MTSKRRSFDGYSRPVLYNYKSIEKYRKQWEINQICGFPIEHSKVSTITVWIDFLQKVEIYFRTYLTN